MTCSADGGSWQDGEFIGDELHKRVLHGPCKFPLEGKNPPVCGPLPFEKGANGGFVGVVLNTLGSFSCAVCTESYLNDVC